MTDPASDRDVVTPAGLPILEAAAWVGGACWAELRIHEVLTRWLAVEADPDHVIAFWTQRSDAAERAEAWHRRLPELREHQRSEFVQPSSPAVAQLFDALAVMDGPDDGAARRAALAAVLAGLRLGYQGHRARALGPADGPTAHTLDAALRSPFGTGAADPEPDHGWSAAIADAGGLP